MMKALYAATILAVLVIAAPAVHAHHGWSWTTGGNIDLTGVIKAAQLGNPHGVLTVDVEGETWTVEVGQPWRNENAGLKDADFAVGRTMRFIGEPAADKTKKLLKAERIFIGKKEHKLYPERN